MNPVDHLEANIHLRTADHLLSPEMILRRAQEDKEMDDELLLN